MSLTSSYILNWSKWILVIDILSQILLSLLPFIALQIMRNVLICCVRLLGRLLSGVCNVNNKFTPQKVIDWFHYGEHNLSWMSTNNTNLFQFQIQGPLQKQGIWMPVYQNSFRRKMSAICTISDTIFFSHQNYSTHLPYWVVWSLPFVIKPSNMFQNDSFYFK